MKLKRILALMGALLIPVLFIVSIFLFIANNPNAMLFLAIALGASVFFLPVMYLAAKFPKDMGQVYVNFADMMDESEKGEELKGEIREEESLKEEH